MICLFLHFDFFFLINMIGSYLLEDRSIDNVINIFLFLYSIKQISSVHLFSKLRITDDVKLWWEIYISDSHVPLFCSYLILMSSLIHLLNRHMAIWNLFVKLTMTESVTV